MPFLSTLVSILMNVRVSKDGRFFVNHPATNKAIYLKKGVIVPNDTTTTNNRPDNPASTKEAAMIWPIQYIIKHAIYQEVRVITNMPTEVELTKYGESISKGMPFEGLMAVNTGDYQPWLLIHRAHEKNIPFRLNIVSNGVLNHLVGRWAKPEAKQRFIDEWTKSVGKSNFAWANASSSFFLQFPGIDAWGLEILGITANDYPKLGKRGNEFARMTETAVHIEDENLYPKLLVDDSLTTAEADGWSFISKRFALMHAATITDPAKRRKFEYLVRSGKLRRFTIRIKGIDGGKMLKGHAVVMPNSRLQGNDIITHPENLKAEVLYEGFVHSTLEEYHPVGEAGWDIQRRVMNPQVLTDEHRSRDLNRLMTEVLGVIETGTFPEWVIYSAEEHDESDDVMGSNRAHYQAEDDAIFRWQAAGFDINAAANMARMAFGGIINKMGRDFDKVEKGVAIGSARSMWVPKSNAFVAAIGCHESLVKLGGYKTDYDGSKAWLDPNIGVMLPGRRTLVLSLWGGADFDDSVEFNLVKIWSSDPNVTKTMKLHGVIGDEIIPTNPQDAVYRAAGLRAPNSPGEYAFLDFENILDLPWQFLDLDNVEVIDLATLPDPAPVMKAKSTMMGMTPSLVHSKAPWTRDNALHQIFAQQANRGIGAAANALMAWCGVAGVSMPPKITAEFEKLVDGAQQLHDPAIFAAVSAEAPFIIYQALEHLRINGGQVDSYLLDRFGDEENRMAAAHFAYDGPLTKFQNDYKAAILKIYNELQNQTLQRRVRQPIIQWVSGLGFGTAAKAWAAEFIKRYTTEFNVIMNKHKSIMREIERYEAEQSRKRTVKNSINKTAATRNKSRDIRALIDKAVEEINTFDRPGQRVLALWQAMVKPTNTTDRKYGGYDWLMFQQGNGVSLMDILIETIHERLLTDTTLQAVFEATEIVAEEDEMLFPETLDPQEGIDISDSDFDMSLVFDLIADED